MAKTVYNKNVTNPSDVTASVFSSDEQLKYGEIVLCNNIDEPGIYIFTKSDGGETKIQKINSVDNIILKQAVDPSAEGPVENGDTLYEIVSKFQNQIDDLSGGGESEAEKVNRIIAAVDLNEDGSYKIIAGNYVGDATSIADAISKLDAAINTVSGSTVEEAKDYADAKITESIGALDAEVSAGDGEVFVKITEADGIVSGDVKSLSVEKDATGLKYDLKLGDYVFGSVDIPQDQFLQEVIFISAATVEDVAEALNYGQHIELGKPYLKFVWRLEEGLKPTYVDVSGLIDVYTAADVKLSDAYSGTSFDIKSGDTLEDAVGKITNELTSIEESITASEIASSGKTILVQSSATGTNIDVNIDGDTIVADETVAGQGKLSVKLEVERQHIDTGYVRTQYILKSSGSTYGVINDTRDVVVGDADEYINVTTEQVSDQEGNRTDKLTITPTIQKNINNATSESVEDGNGLVTAWGVKSYIRDGMDGDGIMVGDDTLQPHSKYYGAINFDGQSLSYDTVHEGFYKVDNNTNRLAESIGFDFGHQESGITPNEILAYPGNNNAEAVEKTHFSAATTIMEALISLDDNQPFEWGEGEKAIQSVGTACSATGDYSFAVGYETKASGDYSNAEGELTTASGRASHAEGESTTASGDYSHAEGEETRASGYTSHAEGSSTKASGQYSHAEGRGTIASGNSSHAECYQTEASGDYSHAEGMNTEAIGDVSHAEGMNTEAIGDVSHAEGNQTEASGANSHAEGSGTQAIGENSHAEGNSTEASGEGSHAEGFSTMAGGAYSHAEGNSTIASGSSSHAEGGSAQARGESSHAEGNATQAIGDYSHAEGSYTITNNEAEHASGKWNKSTVGDQIFSIGIGNGPDNRKNAIEVHSGGTIFGEVILTTSGDVMSVTSTGKLADATTIKSLVDNMDYTADTEENKVFTGITQTNGHVAVTSENLTSRKLAGYGTTADTKVAATQTLGTALGNLQGQIDSMDYTANTSTDKVFTYIQEVDGKVSTSGDLLTNRIITGYAVGSDAKIAATDSLGTALGKVQAQIDAMDLGSSADTNQVITDVTQNDGKVSHVYSDVTGRKLRGYAVVNTTDPAATTAKVATGDTLGQALGKLQGQIDSMDKTTVAEENSLVSDIIQTDGRITATTKHIVDVKLSGYTEGATTSGKVSSGDTLGQALGKLQGQVNGLDWTGTTTANEVFTGITETDGKVSASTALITSRTLSGYSATANTKVAATQTLGVALGNLQGQIDSLDYTANTSTDKVFTYVEQSDGKLTASAENITNRVITGYAEGTDADVAATDTLGQALGKLQKQINSMDYTANTGSDKVFTYVAEADGKLTTSAESITSRVITGYAEATDADVASTDTLGVALGKLQKQINSMDYTANTGSDKVFTYVAEADGKLTTSAENITSRVITGYAVGSDAKIAATDTLGGALGKVQGQINAMDKTASSETGKFVRTVAEADGKVSETLGFILDSDIKITSASPSSTNVKEEWQLVNNQGTKLGDTIKIYKDSSLNSVTLSGDSSTTGQWMIFNYTYSDGSTGNTAVDISKFLVQAEFQSGVTANNAGIVHGVVSGNSESVVTAYTATGGANGTAKVLGVDGGGFYVNNIQTAINAKVNNAISLLDSSSATTNAGYYMTGITITDGKITAIGQAQLTAQETELSTGNSTTATGNVVTGLSVSDHAITLNKKNFPEVAWKRVTAGGTNIDATTTADTISIVTGNTGITLAGDATNKKITISHTDTSSQASVDAGSGKFIKSVSVDTYGHVTGLTTADTVNSATTAADSAKVAGKTVGNANGNVPLSNGTVNSNLNADMVDGKHVAVVSAIPSTPDANTIYILA